MSINLRIIFRKYDRYTSDKIFSWKMLAFQNPDLMLDFDMYINLGWDFKRKISENRRYKKNNPYWIFVWKLSR